VAESAGAMRARVRASFERQAMMATLGAEMAMVEPGLVELTLRHDPRFTQQHGFLHAGAVAAVLDSACGYAAFSVMPADAAVLTVSYSINLLAPAAGERFLARGTVVRAGRTLVVCRGDAFADGSDRPFAVMQATLSAIYDRPDIRY
jgi:uncharacterized protein (TIGR00369 family)